MSGILIGLAVGFIVSATLANFMHSDRRVFTLSYSILAVATSILAVGLR